LNPVRIFYMTITSKCKPCNNAIFSCQSTLCYPKTAVTTLPRTVVMLKHKTGSAKWTFGGMKKSSQKAC